ncbi:ribonuclease P protein component [Magnetofaba australis]|uniref:ribonuclease P protein component n=1 Tax=Magnetofaba australis TaxID=1472297 RepID=UPI000A19F769|nr:ribonuclease P protein component [Magnetofaba australis]
MNDLSGERAPSGRASGDLAAPARKPAGFPKSARLLKSRDFQRVMARRQRRHSPCFVLYYVFAQPNESAPGARIGLTVSRKVGKAHDRNRIKRLAREWFRLRRAQLTQPMDLVLIAKPPARLSDNDQLRAELNRLIKPFAQGATPAPRG